MFKHGFPPEWSTFKKLIWLVGSGIAGAASGIWKTVTGTLIHITDALASPMQKLEVSLEPIQAGSGDPSPDNVRPITGWTGCEATRTGKNLYDSETAITGYAINASGVIVEVADGAYSPLIPVEVGEKYTFSAYSGNSNSWTRRLHFYDSDGNWVSQAGYSSNYVPLDSRYEITALVPSGVSYARFSYDYGYSNQRKDYNEQFEKAPSASDYEQYQGTTFSVTFPALGKNIASFNELLPKYSTSTSGIDLTVSDGTITFSGTATASGTKFFGNMPTYAQRAFTLKAGIAYTVSIKCSNHSKAWIQGNSIAEDGTTSGWITISNYDSATGRYYSDIAAQNYDRRIAFLPVCAITDGEELNETVSEIQLSYTDSGSPVAYEPYTNTAYGGKFDFVSGNLKPYKEYDSYNGETLTGEWMSSIDKYVPGTTPTIGAQVVDLDGYDTTVQLPPQEISTLKDENNVWGDGTIELTYKAQAE